MRPNKPGSVLLSGLRRLSIVLLVIVAGTGVVSLVLGALARSNLLHAEAVGFYIVGVAVLIGSFVLGIRGPMRAEWGDMSDQPRGRLLARRVRKATPEERAEGRRNSLALFALGLLLIVIGGLFDPTRRVF